MNHLENQQAETLSIRADSMCRSRYGSVRSARAMHQKSERDRERETGSITKEQQLDVLGGLNAIFFEVFFDLLAARQSGAFLGRRSATHGYSAHGVARYARQRRAPGMLPARRRAQVAPRTRSIAHAYFPSRNSR